MDRKNMKELMEMLGLMETLDRVAKANGVRWYGHVIRRDDDSDVESEWAAKARTAKNDVEESKKVGLKIEEAADRSRWREGVRAIAEGMRCIRLLSVTKKKTN